LVLNLHRKHSKKPGDSPGTIVYVGDQKDVEIKLQLITYDATNFSEQEISIDEISKIKDKPGIKWLNVTGIHQPELIERIGKQFDVHSLVLEDIANSTQQPKIEAYPEIIYAVLKMFYIDSKDEIRMEHTNFILKKNILISFQESQGNVFEPVRKRIRDGRKKLRESDSDYLFYALVDAIVDHYFSVIHQIGEKADILKRSITNNANKNDLVVLDKLQEEVLVIQHSIEPVEKIFPELKDYESTLIKESNSIYFRDLHDHIMQVSSTTNALKEKISSINDFYLSAVSNRTNEVMKTLALVATICVPITVVAGIYGMNFQYMPELSSPFAYPIVLASMAGIGLSLYGYFRKKKWV